MRQTGTCSKTGESTYMLVSTFTTIPGRCCDTAFYHVELLQVMYSTCSTFLINFGPGYETSCIKFYLLVPNHSRITSRIVSHRATKMRQMLWAIYANNHEDNVQLYCYSSVPRYQQLCTSTCYGLRQVFMLRLKFNWQEQNMHLKCDEKLKKTSSKNAFSDLAYFR